MRAKGLLIGNYLLFMGFLALFVAFQNSVWFQVLGSLPAPQMWIPVLVFWCIYREPHESVIMTYLLTAMISTQTSLTFAMFLSINICIFASVWLIKQRFYWSGSGFYLLMSGVSTLLFFMLHTLFSLLLESNPLRQPEWFSWILSPLLTMFFALTFYYVFFLFDRITSKQIPREASGGGF